MKEISLFAGSLQLSGPLFAMLTTLLKLTIPYIIRYVEYGSAISGFNWTSWLYVGVETLVILLVQIPNYLFVYAGFIDF